MRRLALILLLLTLVPLGVGAQSIGNSREMRKSGKLNNSGMIITGREMEKMIEKAADPGKISIDYGKYSDDKMKEIEEKMNERDWKSEPTAWEQACKINTKASYQRYMAMYPNGEHIAEANKRFISLQVTDVFNGHYNDLPEMTHTATKEDADSPTSTIFIDNNTAYMLTVLYDGEDSKSVRIAPGSRGFVTITNGFYRIAASVDAPWVRPYAGSKDFAGGTYEIGFWVVQGGM